jgi:hypothetical protein
MKRLHRIYSVAVVVMICLYGVPAPAATAPGGTLVRIVDGRVQFGDAQSFRSNRPVEDVVEGMDALRTRVSQRIYRRNYENALALPVGSITPKAPQRRKP